MLTLFIIISGFVAMNMSMGYYTYTVHGLQEFTIRNGFTGSGGTGHLQIHDLRALSRNENFLMEFGIPYSKELLKEIRSNPDVELAMARLEFGGMVSNRDKSFPFIGLGINPLQEKMLRDGLKVEFSKLKLGSSVSEKLSKIKNGVVLEKTWQNL